MERAYVTLRGQGESTLEIKRSRFIGMAAHVQDEAVFRAMLGGARQAHADASHHAFAYRLGRNGTTARFSDDGEPGGTAGRPIMEVLLREDCVDACVIVTRYFGGTLLGSGGLARAYGQAAAEAVRAAGFARMTPHSVMTIVLGYHYFGALEQALAHAGYRLSNSDFAAEVTVAVYVAVGGESLIEALAADVTAGTARVSRGEVVYLPAT